MRVGQLGFRALTTALGVATVYLTVTFSVNVYRGLSWHKAHTPKIEKEASDGQN